MSHDFVMILIFAVWVISGFLQYRYPETDSFNPRMPYDKYMFGFVKFGKIEIATDEQIIQRKRQTILFTYSLFGFPFLCFMIFRLCKTMTGS